jgi:hypothetical protein
MRSVAHRVRTVTVLATCSSMLYMLMAITRDARLGSMHQLLFAFAHLSHSAVPMVGIAGIMKISVHVHAPTPFKSKTHNTRITPHVESNVESSDVGTLLS